MRKISVFAEGHGHELLLNAVLTRMLQDHGMQADVKMVSVRGGFGTVQKELSEYVDELLKYRHRLPDLLIVAADANCQGVNKRIKPFQQTVEAIQDRIIYAIPDPHVERWLLCDPAAFKAVLGKPCQTVKMKCDRDRYKKLLIDSIRDAGTMPLLGGWEYADDIIQQMDLNPDCHKDEFGDFLGQIHARLRLWEQNHANP
jgi:hypothetical protein